MVVKDPGPNFARILCIKLTRNFGKKSDLQSLEKMHLTQTCKKKPTNDFFVDGIVENLAFFVSKTCDIWYFCQVELAS